ncbi:predicted protein [Naegleria gruberi]|uniref:Predicted protein n=1 Tax=Naegleria gruberi TaxID=5762 RepID=D2VZF6_NAEGR|nr:uncharacterized protein NAEGRDRAFT_74472 [Naegleria gruberi]EFC37836.1 predicted protein [Naegleria gruberi]|eukprot:XP_002670580.1 predicted protein [Naegleria gruberi strain NEG-M]
MIAVEKSPNQTRKHSTPSHHHHKKYQSPTTSQSHHHQQNVTKSASSPNNRNPQHMIDSFNSIPTHLSSSSRSEDVYCNSSNCSTLMEEEEIQSCNSVNSSLTSSLDESCVSSSVCTNDVISISANFLKYRQQSNLNHSHQSNSRPSQYKKTHETNQSYPVILPSHETSKKQAFENNTSSFPHKSFDHHAQLRRIQSERCEPLLNPHENTLPESAQFPSSLSNNYNKNNNFSPILRFKSNKIHCLCHHEQFECNNNNVTIDSLASPCETVRKTHSPNRTPSHQRCHMEEEEGLMRMNSNMSLCPPSQGDAFASYVVVGNMSNSYQSKKHLH